MEVDLRQFFRACNPGKILRVEDSQERKYYIDFASVRGAEVVEELGRTIDLMHPDPTCQLFSGHIGCGKSTELLRLKADLEGQGFHVVYFESSQYLDMGDLDIGDILLAIAHQVSESLEAADIPLHGSYFANLLQECADFLQTPIDLEAKAEVSFGIGKLTAKTKESPKLRSQIRQYLEPQTEGLLRAINNQLLLPAAQELQKRGKQGVVVIIDNLDRVDNRQMPSGQSLAEYLFVARGEQLGQLKCHVVYTLPLVLIFSNELQALTNRLGNGNDPIVLPMVPVRRRDGSEHEEGMQLLRQMVLARAFPDGSPEERLAAIDKVFDSAETLDRLCRMSGGHVRNLLGLLFKCLKRAKTLPLTRENLEVAIRENCDLLTFAITNDEWELLRQVRESKKVTGEAQYQTLLRSLFVFEYRDRIDGCWFDLNPMLAEAQELQ